MKLSPVFPLLLLLAAPDRLLGGTIYVDPGEKIQAAIDAAADGDLILVRAGTYSGEGNRDLTSTGKAIVLRGEAGPEATIIDCGGSSSEPHRGFLFSSGEGPDCVVSGFTVRNGNAYYGGGIYCIGGCSPTILDCIITGNKAGETYSFGGGICLRDHCNPLIAHCTIEKNVALSWRGGGIAFDWYCHPTITDCVIRQNKAGYQGGGVYAGELCGGRIDDCLIEANTSIDYGGGVAVGPARTTTISNCIVRNNTAWSDGGGLYLSTESEPTVRDCTVHGNTSGRYGGGIYTHSARAPVIRDCVVRANRSAIFGGGIECHMSSPLITNCLIVGNRAGQLGGGIDCWGDPNTITPAIMSCTIVTNSAGFDGGGLLCEHVGRRMIIGNCILWGNDPCDFYTSSSLLVLSHCAIQGGSGHTWFDPTTCIDGDPLFVRGPLHECYLSHVALGQPVDSPCIDAGSDPAADLGLGGLTTRQDGETDGGVADLGYHARPAPWICAIEAHGNDVLIRWNGRQGVSFVVACSNDDGTWLEVPVGEVLAWTDPGALMRDSRCYRVREVVLDVKPTGCAGALPDEHRSVVLSAPAWPKPARGNVSRGRGNVGPR